MGVGGLDHEFNAIFRRAFASRVFPPEVVEQIGELEFKLVLSTVGLRPFLNKYTRWKARQGYPLVWSAWYW